MSEIGAVAKMNQTGHYRVLRPVQCPLPESPRALQSSFIIFCLSTKGLKKFLKVFYLFAVEGMKTRGGVSNFLFFVMFVKDADSISIPNPHPTLSGHQYRQSPSLQAHLWPTTSSTTPPISPPIHSPTLRLPIILPP